MKSVIAVIVAVAAGLFVANMLGVAVAEAPTGTPVRTVSVDGVATVPIGQKDNAAEANAAYREAMAAAVADGQGKAAFLAGKVTAALGPVQNVTEGGGSISCTTDVESEYAEYEGERPDFASTPETLSASVRAIHKTAHVVPPGKPKHGKHKSPKAKKATAGTCKLSAQVSLVYTIN